MKVTAAPIIARDLEPGDLFSTVGQEYWDHIDARGGVGERVYIRTNALADQFCDADCEVYRLTIQRDTLARQAEPDHASGARALANIAQNIFTALGDGGRK